MCLLTLGAALSAVGTLASAGMAAYSYSAQAKFANQQAIREEQKGAYEAARVDDSTTRQIAKMRSGYLSSGISLDGSATDVIADSAAEASLDSQALKYSAGIKADNYRFEAKLAKANMASAIVGGAIGAISPFINASSQQKTFKAQTTMISNPYAQYATGLY